ncbi:MAG: hypothetical protein LBH63_04270 [Clostridiales Family XIII bacterium]|nr:hypothetical protein [Clostridiales Family XIII bacterium]
MTVVRELLDGLKGIPLSVIANKRRDTETKDIKAKLSVAKHELRKKTDDLGALKSEIVKSIRGASNFTPELLNEMIAAAECERDKAEQSIRTLSETLANTARMFDRFKEQHDRYVSFAEIFDECEMNVKNMIVCELIDKVTVSEGYIIDVTLTVTMEQYRAFAKDTKGERKKSAWYVGAQPDRNEKRQDIHPANFWENWWRIGGSNP